MNDNALFTDSRGAVAVMVAISLVMLLGFAALVIDIGHALVTRNELQNVADAAVLAGARQLGKIYEPLTPAQQATYTLTSQDQSAIIAAVQAVAQQNYAAGTAIVIGPADIQIGDWSNATKTLTVTNSVPDAVRARARRDSSASGNTPISTFLAGLMGVQSIDVSAPATAALTGQSTTTPGELDAPFGISEDWFTSFGCNQPIKFHPTGTPIGCAGWTTFNDPANANTLRNTVIDGLLNGTYTTPPVTVGQTPLNFFGGSVASAFPNLINLWNAQKIADASSPTGFSWEIFVAVYGGAAGCANPTGALPIVGFANVKVTNVQDAPTQQIDGIVTCGQVNDGRGGGSDFGTMGSIPGLVQ